MPHRDQILFAKTLEDLFFSKDSPFDNFGTPGSGLHINVGFKGLDGKNPFYNPNNPDIGTPVTWNAAKGIIDVTAESVLPFAHLAEGSFNRIGHKEWAGPSVACYSPIKRMGAIVKQTPYTQEFYDKNGISGQDVINEKNAHIEIRCADCGHGSRDGMYATLMTQVTVVLGAICYGLEQNQINSYAQLLEYNKGELYQNQEYARESFAQSTLYKNILGNNLHSAVLEFINHPSRQIEECISKSTPDTFIPEELTSSVPLI